MTDHATQSTIIDATPEQCFAVVIDFERYPDWATDVKQVTVERRDDDGEGGDVIFRAAAMGRSTTYTLRYFYGSNPLRMAWRLIDGDLTRKLDGEYEFVSVYGEPRDRGRRTTSKPTSSCPCPGVREAACRVAHHPHRARRPATASRGDGRTVILAPRGRLRHRWHQHPRRRCSTPATAWWRQVLGPAPIRPTPSSTPSSTWLVRLEDRAEADRRRASGVGCAGVVDSSGTVRSLAEHRRARRVPAAGHAAPTASGEPVVVDNDATMATLAEVRAGAAVGVDDVVFVPLGTGIGAGFVLDGRLMRGAPASPVRSVT